MTLAQFISKYDGEHVGDGQCGSLVRAYWNEVDLTTPPSYPNSKDYWFNPVPGYDKVQTPVPGCIAIYNSHGTFTAGHSAIYVDGRVFEQNADPDGSPAHLYSRANTYLLGYLVKQGGTMPTQVDDGNIDLLYVATIHRHAAQADKDARRGQDYLKAQTELYESNEWAIQDATLKNPATLPPGQSYLKINKTDVVNT